MLLLTDKPGFALRCTPAVDAGRFRDFTGSDAPVTTLAEELFGPDAVRVADVAAGGYWDYLFAAGEARRSQFDVLSGLAAAGRALPDRVLCCAESGPHFHGFRGRGWVACPGNIHLSAYLNPAREVPGGAVGFIVVAAVSAVQALDVFLPPGEGPGVRWVNDIVLGNAKVGGVLARVQTQGPVVTGAVVGIGINVERRPAVECDPFVPEVAALADLAHDRQACDYPAVFLRLTETLGRNLQRFCDGAFEDFLEEYRRRSVIIGRSVTVCEDNSEHPPGIIARGRVSAIGPGLELYIEGRGEAVSRGRLILGEP